MQNGYRETTRGEVVSSKNMDKFQSKRGMKHIKSQFKKTKKNAPLFKTF